MKLTEGGRLADLHLGEVDAPGEAVRVPGHRGDDQLVNRAVCFGFVSTILLCLLLNIIIIISSSSRAGNGQLGEVHNLLAHHLRLAGAVGGDAKVAGQRLPGRLHELRPLLLAGDDLLRLVELLEGGVLLDDARVAGLLVALVPWLLLGILLILVIEAGEIQLLEIIV